MKGITTSGFEYEIDDKALTDWRFVRTMAYFSNLEESDSKEIDFINAAADVEKFIFKDKGKAFEKHIASLHDGQVPPDVLLQELFEIVGSNNKTKNSLSSPI